jgi:Hg(II)-responsive transcriptional regulator
MGQLSSGAVAKQAKVNIETIRYYERRGLLMPDGHRDSGYRIYSDEAVKRLRFIKHAQNLGFTLKEIAGLLRLRVSRSARCPDVKKRATQKLQDVEKKLHQLRAMQRTLKHLIRICRQQGTTDQCPILKSLEE